MTKSDQIKILNNKIKANNAQHNINRLNAEISEIRDHIQNLKDEGIDVNINNDQVNDLVDKRFKGISKRDSTPQDSTLEDSASKDSASEDLTPQDLKSFFKKYEKNI